MTNQEYLESYHLTFTSDNGAKVLADLISEFHDPVGYDPNSSRPEDAVFAAGQRHVIAWIRHNLEAYIKMKQEGQSDG